MIQIKKEMYCGCGLSCIILDKVFHDLDLNPNPWDQVPGDYTNNLPHKLLHELSYPKNEQAGFLLQIYLSFSPEYFVVMRCSHRTIF